MKSDNQSFDKLLSEKLNGRVFEAGPSSWENAEKLILADEARKSSRRRFFFILIALAIFSTGIFTALLVSSDHEHKNKAASVSSGSNLNQPNHSSDENNFKNQADTPAQATGFAKNETQGLNNNPAVINSAGTPAGDKSNSAINGKDESGHRVNGNPVSTEEKNTLLKNTDIHSSTVKNKNAKHPPASVTDLPEKQKRNKTLTKSGGTTGPFLSASPERYANPQNRTLPPAVPNIDTAMQRLNPAQPDMDTAMQRLAYEKKEADTAMQRLNPAQPDMDTAMQRLAYEKKEADTAMQRLTAFETEKDSSGEKAPEQSQMHNSGKANFWFADAGFTFLPGITGMQRSFNPVIGGGYSIHLGMRTGLQIGLNYTSIGNASDSNAVYSNTVYTFGIQHEWYEIRLKQMHYVSMPVHFLWHFKGPNTVFGGLTVNYLMTTASSERSYHESEEGITNENTKTVFGYVQGLNRFDLLATAGYSRNFNARWSMQAAVYTGFIDLKKNSWYHYSQMERNCGIRFTIQYDF